MKKRCSFPKALFAISSLFLLFGCTKSNESSTPSSSGDAVRTFSFVDALEGVLNELDDALPKKKKALKPVEELPASLVETMRNMVALPYYFYLDEAVGHLEHTLAYSSHANIDGTDISALFRCYYDSSTSEVGVYLHVSYAGQTQHFYLHGTYEDSIRSLKEYKLYACDQNDQVNQYLQKDQNGILGSPEREEGFSSYDQAAKSYGQYLLAVEPIEVPGALGRAYEAVRNHHQEEENEAGKFLITTEDTSIRIQAYDFAGNTAKDPTNPLPATIEEDFQYDDLFEGTVFHSYFADPHGGLTENTSEVRDFTAFYLISVEGKDSITFTLTSDEAINKEIIRYVQFTDGVRTSPWKGDPMFPSQGSSSKSLTGSHTDFVLFLEGELMEQILPKITLSIR